jgi:hypothetical protein
MDVVELLQPSDQADSLNQIRQCIPESISRESELGILNFSEVVPRLKSIVTTYRRLTSNVWLQLPDDLKNQVYSLSNNTWQVIKLIQTFTPNQQNPKQERDSLVSQLSSYSTAALQQLSWLSLFDSQTDKIRQIDEFISKLDQATKKVDTLNGEAERALDVAKEAAAQSGISAQVTHFGQAAIDDEALSAKWFNRLCWSAGIVLLCSVLFVAAAYFGVATENTPAAIQFASAKIIMLAVLSYAVLLCARQYSASKHNATINRHKQLALRTFEGFVVGAKTDEIRDAVLLKAATAIFEHQDTGYLKQSSNQTGSLQNVVELITARNPS